MLGILEVRGENPGISAKGSEPGIWETDFAPSPEAEAKREGSKCYDKK